MSVHSTSATTSADPGAYLPGDLVTWRLPIGVPHIGIISERRSEAGTSLIIHNIGAGAVEENILFSLTIPGVTAICPSGWSRRARGRGPRSSEAKSRFGYYDFTVGQLRIFERNVLNSPNNINDLLERNDHG